jgi:hypothetical protein
MKNLLLKEGKNRTFDEPPTSPAFSKKDYPPALAGIPLISPHSCCARAGTQKGGFNTMRRNVFTPFDKGVADEGGGGIDYRFANLSIRLHTA